MNDVNTNRQNLIITIESCHKNSFYSSFPVPTLIAVSKQQPDNKIEDALRAGHRIFGENKLQDGIKRWSNLLDIHKCKKLFHTLELLLMLLVDNLYKNLKLILFFLLALK